MVRIEVESVPAMVPPAAGILIWDHFLTGFIASASFAELADLRIDMDANEAEENVSLSLWKETIEM